MTRKTYKNNILNIIITKGRVSSYVRAGFGIATDVIGLFVFFVFLYVGLTFSNPIDSSIIDIKNEVNYDNYK